MMTIGIPPAEGLGNTGVLKCRIRCTVSSDVLLFIIAHGAVMIRLCCCSEYSYKSI